MNKIHEISSSELYPVTKIIISSTAWKTIYLSLFVSYWYDEGMGEWMKYPSIDSC
jgi:hypothetical protein